MTDPKDISTFIALDTITTRDGDFHEYEFTTSSLDADVTYYVAFLFYSPRTYYAWESPQAAIDGIVIREDNGCNRPLGLAISNECTVVALCSDDNTSIASSALSLKPPQST